MWIKASFAFSTENGFMAKQLTDREIEIRAGVIAALCIAFLFGILFFITFTAPAKPLEDEGMAVNYGFDETGSGAEDAAPAPGNEQLPAPSVDQEVQPTPPTPSESAPSTEENITQDNGEQINLAEKKKKEREEKLRQDQLAREEATRKAEEQARLAKLEEQRKQAEALKNRVAGLRRNGGNNGTGPGGNGTASSQGNGGGSGNQGSPNGNGNTGANNGIGTGTGVRGSSTGSLAGRTYLSGPKPTIETQAEGKVTVRVWVNNDGQVIRAQAGARVTTITDRRIWAQCEANARLHKFSANENDDPEKEGTITYNFNVQ